MQDVFSKVPPPMDTGTITEILEVFANRNISTVLRLENGSSVSGILEFHIDGDDMSFSVSDEEFSPIFVEQIKTVVGSVLAIALYENDPVEQKERDLCDVAYRNDLMGYSDGPDY